MVTSSAVVGSSAMQQRGRYGDGHGDHHALAHAAAELVRISVRRALGVGDADASSSSIARSRARRSRPTRLDAASASAIWLPTVNTGFREAVGSWKIIAISLPRIAAISRRCAVIRCRCPFHSHVAADDPHLAQARVA